MDEPPITVQVSDTGKLIVGVTRRTVPPLYASKYMPRPQQELPKIAYVRPGAPELPGALSAALGTLPEDLTTQTALLSPEPVRNGLQHLWQQPEGSAILLPSATAAEVSFKRNLQTELLLEPDKLPIPAGGDYLKRAAAYLLSVTQPETLLRIAMHWAFACDISHRVSRIVTDSVRHHLVYGPVENREQLDAAAHRLIIPQLVRVIAVDAILSRADVIRNEDYNPAQFSDLIRGVVSQFFPSIFNGSSPANSEIRTALWILSFDSPFGSVGTDPVGMLMAHTFGRQSVGDDADDLTRWIHLVSMSDDHPHGLWTTGEAPSDLRRELRNESGLDLRTVVSLSGIVLSVVSYFQACANQLWTAPTLAQFAESQMPNQALAAMSYLVENLARSADLLNDPHTNTQDLVDSYGAADVIGRRRAIENWMIERPFWQFEDGVLIPIGVPDVVYGLVSHCHVRSTSGENRRRKLQRFGNALGHCFEAYVKELCDTLDRHNIVGSDLINRIVDAELGKRSKRADLAIGDDQGHYLVLEVTKRGLLGGIRYGDADALRRWAGEHLEKYDQTRVTLDCLHAITSEGQLPTPIGQTSLVVCELPLPQTFGLTSLFAAQSGEKRPPFVCSISEFEMLLKLSRSGYSIPTVVGAWQGARPDAPLGQFLLEHPFA